MPFEKTNNPVEGASWADFQARNNPLAGDSNVMKVYGLNNPGCDDDRLDIDLTYAVNGGGASIDFTQNTNITGLRYYKIYVTDQNGQEASGLVDIADVTTGINIDTSALNPAYQWKVAVSLSPAAPAVDCNCETCYFFYIDGIAGNPTDTIETATPQGTLQTQVSADGVAKTVVASGGSQALTAAAVGDVVEVQVYLSSTVAGSLMQVQAASVSGDGSFSQLAPLPVLLNDSIEVTSFVVLMDTSSAGAKTATVTFANDGTVTPHTFDLTLTVA